MRHKMMPEKLITPMRPHDGCGGMIQRLGDSGEMLGGCPVCWSKTTYRWRCSECSYRSAWIEENVAYNAEAQAWMAHHPSARSAAFGHLPMPWD